MVLSTDVACVLLRLYIFAEEAFFHLQTLAGQFHIAGGGGIRWPLSLLRNLFSLKCVQMWYRLLSHLAEMWSHCTSQSNSRCDLADPGHIAVFHADLNMFLFFLIQIKYPETERRSIFPCTLTYFCSLFVPFTLSGGSMARKGRGRTANVRWRVWLVSTWRLMFWCRWTLYKAALMW